MKVDQIGLEEGEEIGESIRGLEKGGKSSLETGTNSSLFSSVIWFYRELFYPSI